MSYKKMRALTSLSGWGAKKYKGIHCLYRKADNLIIGYYFTYTGATGTVRKRADIPPELLETKKPNRKAVELAIAQKSKTKGERTEKSVSNTRELADMDLTALVDLFHRSPNKKGERRDPDAVRKDWSAFQRLVPDYIRNKRISRITADDIEFIRSELLGQDYSEATVVNLLIILQGAFNYADRKGYRTQRPFLNITVRKSKGGDIQLLTDAQIQAIFDKAKEIHPDLWFHVRMMYYTAQRPRSINDLTRKDINLDKREIYIGEIKGQPENTIPISDKIYEMLEERCEGLEPNDRLETISPKYMAKLATRLFDEINQELYMTKALRESGDELAIATARARAFKENRSKWISRYSFRHTAATNLYKNSGDIYLVQSILNHSDPKMTMRYAQQDKGKQRGALNDL